MNLLRTINKEFLQKLTEISVTRCILEKDMAELCRNYFEKHANKVSRKPTEEHCSYLSF